VNNSRKRMETSWFFDFSAAVESDGEDKSK
jgi:hypothetical protein